MKKNTKYSSPPNGSKNPSIEQIEMLLEHIQPNPSQRFLERMDTLPWNRKTRLFLLPWLWDRKHRAIFLVSIFLGLIIILATPSLVVVANRIAQFFTTSQKEYISIEVPIDNSLSQGFELIDSIAEASRKADFSIYKPEYLPDNFHFRGAGYNDARKVVTLFYDSDDGSIIRVSQRPKGIEYQSISVNALVEHVHIGPYPGEYVKGSWKVVAPNQMQPKTSLTVTLQADWNPQASTMFLRWQQMDILIEIIYNGNSDDSSENLSKSDLIMIAESFQ